LVWPKSFILNRGGHFLAENRRPNRTEPKPNRIVGFWVRLRFSVFRSSVFRVGFGFSVYRTEQPK
jgi:hypothetical protein